jgi:hypothetical protein
MFDTLTQLTAGTRLSLKECDNQLALIDAMAAAHPRLPAVDREPVKVLRMELGRLLKMLDVSELPPAKMYEMEVQVGLVQIHMQLALRSFLEWSVCHGIKPPRTILDRV